MGSFWSAVAERAGDVRAAGRVVYLAAAVLAAGFVLGYATGCARWHHDHLVCRDGACWTEHHAPQQEEP